MFANSRPLASNFKNNSRSLQQFLHRVGQNNFRKKTPKHTKKSNENGILFQILFRSTMRRKCQSDPEKLLQI